MALKMHKRFFTVAVVCLVTACNQTPPKCSDDDTLQLVREIVFGEEFSEKELRDNVAFEYPLATDENKSIKKISCEAKMKVANRYELPITYETQLDDDNQHIVSVGGIGRGDAYQLLTAMKAAVEKSRASVKVDAVADTVAVEEPASLQGPSKVVSLPAIQALVTGKTYSVAREQLLGLGLNPNKEADLQVFNMLVVDDAAECGNAGCSIPWLSQGTEFCIGVQVNDNLAQQGWKVTGASACNNTASTLPPESTISADKSKNILDSDSKAKKLDRCEAIALAKTYKTYGEVRWALTKSDDLAPIPPDESSPDTVAGDGASCDESTCEMEWWTYRYGNLALTIKVEPGVKETLWPVTKIEASDHGCKL